MKGLWKDLKKKLRERFMDKKIIVWILVIVVLLGAVSYAAEGISLKELREKAAEGLEKLKEAGGKAAGEVKKTVSKPSTATGYQKANNDYNELKDLIVSYNLYKSPEVGKDFTKFYDEKINLVRSIKDKSLILASFIEEGDKNEIVGYYGMHAEAEKVKEQATKVLDYITEFKRADERDQVVDGEKDTIFFSKYDEKEIEPLIDITLTGEEKDKVKDVDDEVQKYTGIMRFLGNKEEADAIDEGAKTVKKLKKYGTWIKWGGILFLIAMVIFILSMIFKPVAIAFKVGKGLTKPIWWPAKEGIKKLWGKLPIKGIILGLLTMPWVIIRNLFLAIIKLFSEKVDTDVKVKRGRTILRFLKGRAIAFKNGLFYLKGRELKKSVFLTDEEKKLPPKEQKKLIKERVKNNKALIKKQKKDLAAKNKADKERLVELFEENERVMKAAQDYVELQKKLERKEISPEDFAKEEEKIKKIAREEKEKIIELEELKRKRAEFIKKSTEKVEGGDASGYSDAKEVVKDYNERIEELERDMRGEKKSEAEDLEEDLKSLNERKKRFIRDYRRGASRMNGEQYQKELKFIDEEIKNVEEELREIRTKEEPAVEEPKRIESPKDGGKNESED